VWDYQWLSNNTIEVLAIIMSVELLDNIVTRCAAIMPAAVLSYAEVTRLLSGSRTTSTTQYMVSARGPV
jgi:hypothetical protein